MSSSTLPIGQAAAPSLWPRRLLLTALGLLLLIWLLPIAAARSPLVGWLEGRLAARTGGSVRLGSLSLGWFSPITAYDVDLRDAAGQPLLTAGIVETHRTLLGLLLNRHDPGGLRVEKAAVTVVFAGAESNLQQALSQLIPAPSNDRAAPREAGVTPPIDVEIVDSRVTLRDQDGCTWELAPMHATILLFHDEDLPVQARVFASLSAGATTGTIEASLSVHADGGVWKRGECKTRLQNIPLELATTKLRRLVPGATLAGTGQGQCLVSWNIDRGRVTQVGLDGDFTGRSCLFRAPAMRETLVLDHVRMPCKLRYDGSRLDVLQAELVADLGQVRYSGTIDCGGPGWTWLDRPGHEASATLDLVRLADRLPKTLHVHPDLRLTSGQIRLEAKSGPDGDPGWEGRLTVTNITGVRGNQPIVWQEPVILDARARQIGVGVPLVEEVHCTSGFLQLDGTTTADGFRFQGDADLGKLADPLSRFIDLGTTRLAGQAHGELTVRATAERRFVATGNGKITDLFVEWVKGRPVEEEVVRVELSAAGQVALDGVQSVESARVMLRMGADTLRADLAEPITELGSSEWGTWQFELDGDLARWQKRARPSVLALDRWQLAGALHAQGQFQHGYRGVECPSLAAFVRDFRCEGPGLRLAEPNLYVHTAAGFDLLGTLHLRDLQVRCASVTAGSVYLHGKPDSTHFNGTVKFRGDLARLQRWFPQAHGHLVEQLSGEAAGQLDLRPDGEALEVGFHVAVKDFACGECGLPPGREPELSCAGRARLESNDDRLVLGPLRVESSLGTLDLQAKVECLSSTCDLDATGEVSYDLARIGPLFDAALGAEVRMAGKDTRPFTVAGPLCPIGPTEGLNLRLLPRRMTDTPLQIRDLHGSATLSWTSVQALGCAVGPADVRLKLQKGWLQAYPIETSINGGRLRVQPSLRLDPTSAEVIVAAGPVIEKARITPAVCAGALGYALPALGKVAQAEGTWSLILEGGRIPLDDPTRADVKGKLILDNARFGAGPLSRELSSVFKKPAPDCRVRSAAIPFHLSNGRIYHRDLELAFPDGTIRSSGSVGLDGSLALMLEMPIPAALVASGKLSPALARQTIRLPILGTVDEPRIDARALNAVIHQIMRDVAGNAIEQRLKGLLKPGGGQ